MGYILGQYNNPRRDEESSNSINNELFMSSFGNGTAKRRKNNSDYGVAGGSIDPFWDECIHLDNYLNNNETYYFHARIKRLMTDQVFYIYLVNYDDEGSLDIVETQYLRTITVQAGLETDWVDFEMMFTPLIAFDCILFQLQRNIQDFREQTRFPTIIYQELSIVNNILPVIIQPAVKLVKMGVQSHPGLMMCINREEIHIGRTGSYEVRNGIIRVDFFSVVEAGIEDINGKNPLLINGNIVKDINEYLSYIASLPPITIETDNLNHPTNSICIFNTSKKRSIDPFSLDYMYEED